MQRYVNFKFYVLTSDFLLFNEQTVFSNILGELADIGKGAFDDNVELHYDAPDATRSTAGNVLKDSIVDKEFGDGAVINEKSYVKLASVIDPITNVAVLPPPFSQAMEVIDIMMMSRAGTENGFPRPLSEKEIVDLRYYVHQTQLFSV